MIGLLLLGNSCSSSRKKETAPAEIAVKAWTIGTDQQNQSREYIGIVEEELSSSISFPVSGTLDRIYVIEGQRVAQGTLLAQLNIANLESMHAAALATLEQAEDAMQRIQMLYDSESLAEIKYIETKTKLEQAKSSEAIARKNLNDARLVAPFGGVIGRKTVETGENVMPNQTVLTLLKINSVKVKIPVPEKEIGTIRNGQTIQIKVPALNDETFTGTVTERGVVADPVSHTYNVRATIANAENHLLPGMVCNVTAYDETGKEIITIPNNCVQTSTKGEKFVWKITNGQVTRCDVETGSLTTNGVEIVRGLNLGDEIVSEGYQKVFEGAKIKAL